MNAGISDLYEIDNVNIFLLSIYIVHVHVYKYHWRIMVIKVVLPMKIMLGRVKGRSRGTSIRIDIKRIYPKDNG